MANAVEEIIAMATNMRIGMITEMNMAAATNSSDWWFDFGATVHVCNEKAQFKTYVIVTDGKPQFCLGLGKRDFRDDAYFWEEIDFD